MNQKQSLNLNHALIFLTVIFFLGLTGCTEGGKKHSIKLQEPEIYLTSRQEYVKLTSFQEKMRTNQNLVLTAADKLVFAPGDSAKGLRITTSCLISGGVARSTTIDPFTWNRSFRSEISFLEMIPFSVLQKALKQEIPSDASLTCAFAITAMGDGGSTHRMDLPMVAFDIQNLPSEINLQSNLSENLSRSRSSRALTSADKVQVTFICSGGVADEYVSSVAIMTSDRSTEILAAQQSENKISWFAAQQFCRIGFLDSERVLTSVSNAFVVQVPRRNVSVSFVHNRDFFYPQNPDTFKLGTFVIRNLTNAPLVVSAPQVAQGLLRYIVILGDTRSWEVGVSGFGQGLQYTDQGSVRLAPRLPIDHLNQDGTIDVYLAQGGEASIDVFGIDPGIQCGSQSTTVPAIFIAQVLEQSESALAIHEMGPSENSGYTKGAIVHRLATTRSSYSALTKKEFERGRNTAQFMTQPELVAESPSRPIQPARCLNGRPNP